MRLPWELMDCIALLFRPEHVFISPSNDELACVTDTGDGFIDEEYIRLSIAFYEENASRRKTLAKLARTCRHLNATATSLLYESIEFPVLAFTDAPMTTAYMYGNPIFRLLKRRPAVARLVRHVHVFFDPYDEWDDSCTTATYLLDYVKLCRNIDSVSFDMAYSDLVQVDIIKSIAQYAPVTSVTVTPDLNMDLSDVNRFYEALGSLDQLDTSRSRKRPGCRTFRRPNNKAECSRE